MQNRFNRKGIMIVGPTAVGKTRFAVSVASYFNGEIISIDSRQVYKHLDIGTGKDLEDYKTKRGIIKHHLIDIVEPYEQYNLTRFCMDFRQVCLAIPQSILPVAVGGSPMYVSAILNDYALNGGPPDTETRTLLKKMPCEEIVAKIKQTFPGKLPDSKDVLNNKNRLLRIFERLNTPDNMKPQLPQIKIDWLIIGIFRAREQVHQRIKERLETRLENGMIAEVEKLHKSGLSWEQIEYFGLEYKWVSLFLQNKISLDEMKNSLLAKIRQFARRQDVWFRKLERQGWKIYWLNPESNYKQAFELIKTFRENNQLPEPNLRISQIYYGPKSN